jgi:hypothetical protein
MFRGEKCERPTDIVSASVSPHAPTWGGRGGGTWCPMMPRNNAATRCRKAQQNKGSALDHVSDIAGIDGRSALGWCDPALAARCVSIVDLSVLLHLCAWISPCLACA